MEPCIGEKGVKCPNPSCEEKWVWDFCQDTYYNFKTGEFCEEIELLPLNPPESGQMKETALISVFRCSCGQMLAFSVWDNLTNGMYNHPDWKDVDWEEEAV